jgi:SAM-dependent methyltransferase
MQREWVTRVLGLIPPGGTVLDAPCGTGKYFAMLAAAGHRVAGADQSAGMLARARARGIAFSLQRTSLQDLPYAARFDAVLTIEAMQHIPPEDWPGVLANLGRAVRPGGLVYLTVQVPGAAPYPAGLREPSRTRAACGAGRARRAGHARLPLFPGS